MRSCTCKRRHCESTLLAPALLSSSNTYLVCDTRADLRVYAAVATGQTVLIIIVAHRVNNSHADWRDGDAGELLNARTVL